LSSVKRTGACLRSLRDELVSSGFRHQQFGLGRVRFDLLAQPVDVCFERMGGGCWIVAPHLIEKRVPADDLLPGAVQELQDVRFLLGEPNLLVVAGLNV
jgi:hypothetical protein